MNTLTFLALLLGLALDTAYAHEFVRSSPQSYLGRTIITRFLQMSSLRSREAKALAEGHRASKRGAGISLHVVRL